MNKFSLLRFYLFAGLLWMNTSQLASAQALQAIDKVVAVVGEKIILQSDLDAQYQELQRAGSDASAQVSPCQVLHAALLQKLLLVQAQLDSLPIEDKQVDVAINQRISFYAQQLGSLENLEKELLGKSVLQFKEEMKPQMRERMLAESMQQKITQNVSITPAEVKAFFEKIPTDSLPLFGTEVEVGQIVRFPSYTKSQKQAAKSKLEAIRTRIKAGEKFSTLAILYSEDSGSARHGGDLGFFDRGAMVGEFEAAAFKLKPGELSPVIETKFGFHLIQAIARRGNQAHVRHILIQPSYTAIETALAKRQLDSLLIRLRNQELSFATAAALYSDDANTKQTAGMLLNPENRASRLPIAYLGQIDQEMVKVLDTLGQANYSSVLPYQSSENGKSKQGYRIIYLKSKLPAHRASLDADYPRLQEATLAEKKQKRIKEWTHQQQQKCFIQISPALVSACKELATWTNKPGRSK